MWLWRDPDVVIAARYPRELVEARYVRLIEEVAQSRTGTTDGVEIDVAIRHRVAREVRHHPTHERGIRIGDGERCNRSRRQIRLRGGAQEVVIGIARGGGHGDRTRRARNRRHEVTALGIGLIEQIARADGESKRRGCRSAARGRRSHVDGRAFRKRQVRKGRAEVGLGRAHEVDLTDL